jgi:cellulose synthase/poly-beta-1,6-N-acetylglucosamine synthase-like glycosyltransferase
MALAQVGRSSDPGPQPALDPGKVFARPPSPLAFLAALAITLAFSFYVFDGQTSVLGWIFTFIWSLPIISSCVGFCGMMIARRRMKRGRAAPVDAEVSFYDKLIVVVPTIGRHDTYPALERSVMSYCTYLPRYFTHLRIDVIAEEGCEAMSKIHYLADRSPLVRVIVVPKHYRTRAGTRFKARANHYSHELRIVEGDVRDDIWVLHMDDDTAVGPDTALSIGRFITAQRRSAEPRHLAQGVLTYPRENAVNWFTWLADSVRPADDLSRFAALTGGGTPLSGLHGELLLIRSSVEADIGWDFGPKAITEDAQLALTFCSLYPGRSDWIEGRCYGASPASVRDFLKQRERWSWGLVGLALNRSIPLRNRLFLGYCVSNWVLGPLQNIMFVLLVAFVLNMFSLSPASRGVLVLWAVNMAFAIWMYWEGYKANIAASASRKHRSPLEIICLILLIPVFSLLEGLGGIRGFYRLVTRKENQFVVISKPV